MFFDLTQIRWNQFNQISVLIREQISLTSFLSRDEQRLYKGLPKSVGTAYSIFVKEKYAEVKERHEDGANVFHEIAQAWKGLSAAEKEKYKKKLSMVSPASKWPIEMYLKV